LSAVPSTISHWRSGWFAIIFLTGYSIATASAYPGDAQSTTALAISSDSSEIGFDDLGFSSELHKVLVPAGRTGKLVLIDPVSRKLEEIGGFSSQSYVGGDKGQGVTSAAVGRGAIFTADRSEKTLDVVDPASKTILSKPNWHRAPTMYVMSTRPTKSGLPNRTPRKSRSFRCPSMVCRSRITPPSSRSPMARNRW
jgi:hypothetical protein